MADTSKDRFANDLPTLEGPANDFYLVTPHDTNALEGVSSGIVVGTVGALTVITKKGRTVTIPSQIVSRLPIIPLQVTHIKSTGTDASNIGVFFSK